MNTWAAFREEVQDFFDSICDEYMSESEIVWGTDEEPEATLWLTSSHGEKYEIPIVWGGATEIAVISLDGAGFFNLDAAGYWCYLWNDACDQARREKKRVRLAVDAMLENTRNCGDEFEGEFCKRCLRYGKCSQEEKAIEEMFGEDG